MLNIYFSQQFRFSLCRLLPFHGSVLTTVVIFLCIFSSPACGRLWADDLLQRALSSVRSVDVNGQGHAAAVPAMKIINTAAIEQVPEILLGMDGANRLATNWLRSAVLSIVDRGGELPRAKIETYFAETTHSHLGRLLAFDLLTENDQALAEKIIPTLSDDPSLPLRAKAIEWQIKQAELATQPVEKVGLLATALDKARSIEQVQKIAKLLGDNGIAVDLQKQLGFLKSWHLVGSFDNQKQAGFDVAYGPEKELPKIDLAASFTNLAAEDANWTLHTSNSTVGVLNLNQLIGKIKGATVYATTTFDADQAQTVELRIGTPNATKVWVNGALVMSNEIYHNSNSIDKFSGTANFKAGKNEILLKICQNEQTEPWAQDWEFQLRVCDATGKAIQPVPLVVAQE